MLRLTGGDREAVAPDRIAGRHLDDLHREFGSIHSQSNQHSEVLLGPAWAVEPQRSSPVLHPEGAQQPGETQSVIGVIVREQHVVDIEADTVLHHLALGAFATVEQETAPGTLQHQGTHAPLDRRDRGAGSQEGEPDHE